MAINKDTFPFEEVIKKSINKRINEIAEEEYAEALKRIEERRHEAITGTVLAVEKYVQYEHVGQELRILIKERDDKD